MTQTDQARVVEFLSSPSSYGDGCSSVEVRETHISHIFLVGGQAYKMKKAVDLGYLDFSTLEKRRLACEAELTLNKRTTPQVYQALVPVAQDSEGQFTLGGTGDVVEWHVKMVRFDEDRLALSLARQDQLSLEMIEALANEIAVFHDAAEPVPSLGGVEGMRVILQSNYDHLIAFADCGLDRLEIEALQAKSMEVLLAQGPLLEDRRANGFVRRCHGDLHLGNIVMEAGGPVLFDCIEFSEQMGSIDTLYDLAFVLMDLCHLGLVDTANRMLNSYLIAAPMKTRQANLQGLALLPLFLSCRAAIRAHVIAQTAKAHGQTAKVDGKADGPDAAGLADAQSYLSEALEFLNPAPPSLVAIGGLSGAGKTSLARALAANMGPVPGAIILRSDELRKHLLGHAPAERLGKEAYTKDVTDRVYAQIGADARVVLGAGHAVIADAVHARPDERRSIELAARSSGAGFVGLWLEAPAQTLERRVQSRHGDASDANVEVLKEQYGYDLGAIGWEHINVAGTLEETTKLTRRALNKRKQTS